MRDKQLSKQSEDLYRLSNRLQDAIDELVQMPTPEQTADAIESLKAIRSDIEKMACKMALDAGEPIAGYYDYKPPTTREPQEESRKPS